MIHLALIALSSSRPVDLFDDPRLPSLAGLAALGQSGELTTADPNNPAWSTLLQDGWTTASRLDLDLDLELDAAPERIDGQITELLGAFQSQDGARGRALAVVIAGTSEGGVFLVVLPPGHANLNPPAETLEPASLIAWVGSLKDTLAQAPAAANLDEEELVKERLRGLGYIE
mgnify:CR=1 FL=1